MAKVEKNLLQENEHSADCRKNEAAEIVSPKATTRRKKLRRSLFDQFKKYIADNDLIGAGDKVIVACSGGPDSLALLYLLKELSSKLKLELVVAHFNHKLRGGEADADEKFVEKTASKLKLKFLSASAKTKITSEDQARELRYEFLQKAREEERAKVIAVAHNLDDLAETVLMNIIRGAGIRGLYSLRAKRGYIVRPLLFAEKKELVSYLSENKIGYRTDESNNDLVYTRNIMRHVILPEIKKINPRALSAIARTSALAAQADEYIVRASEAILAQISENIKGNIIINRKEFVALSPAVQSEIIRIIARQFGLDKDLTFSDVEGVVLLAEKNVGKKFKIVRSRLKIEIESGKIIVSNK
ncbi:MAG: tRNA lysidine(34) synthetase TilS [Candidatus Berkelbacteria bacterium]